MQRQGHGRIGGKYARKHAIQEIDAVGPESHGAVRVEVLIKKECARGPFAATQRVTAAQRNFFGEIVHFLLLLQGEDVLRREILVHEKTVVNHLPRCGRGENKVVERVLHSQAGVEQVTAIGARAVLIDSKKRR